MRIWCHEADLPGIIKADGENTPFLPGYPVDPGIDISNDIPYVLEDAELVLIACPSSHMRRVCQGIADHVPQNFRWLVLSCGGPSEGVQRPFASIVSVTATARWRSGSTASHSCT